MADLFDEFDEDDDSVIQALGLEEDELFDIEYYGSEEAKIEREIDDLEARYGIVV